MRVRRVRGICSKSNFLESDKWPMIVMDNRAHTLDTYASYKQTSAPTSDESVPGLHNADSVDIS